MCTLVWIMWQFPFTAGSYCFKYKRSEKTGRSRCPQWWGRCKALARPSHHSSFFNAHGIYGTPDKTKGEIHVDTSLAHIKEWPSIFKANRNVTVRAPESFVLNTSGEQLRREAVAMLRLHNFPGGYKDVGGDLFKIYYDDELRDWLQFVSAQASSLQQRSAS